MENFSNYTNQEKKIDQYLGTNNLRPGPPRKLIYKVDSSYSDKNSFPKEKMYTANSEINYNNSENNSRKVNSNKNEKSQKNKVNYFSFTREICKDINWDELVSVKKSSSGQGGVFYLEFLQNSTLVLKSSVDIPYLFFGSILKKACSIETPSFRIIEYNDPEFEHLINNMEKVSVHDNSLLNEIKNNIGESVFLLIFEYIPNLSLIEIGPNRSQMVFRDSNSQSRKLFLELGRIMAFDVLINNFDRLPFAWSNHGNVDNFLYKVNLDLLTPNANFKDMSFLDIYIESVVAIDSKPICLDPQDRVALKNLGDYLNRLSEILKLFYYEMKNIIIIGKNVETFEFRSMSKIQIIFKDTCNYLLQGINMFHISEGFIIMMKDIVEIELNDLIKIINFVKNEAISRDWGDVYKNNTKNINIDYFKYILNFLKQIKEENEDIFNWVQDMTMGLYNCDFKKNLESILQFQKKMKYQQNDDKKKNADEKGDNSDNNAKKLAINSRVSKKKTGEKSDNSDDNANKVINNVRVSKNNSNQKNLNNPIKNEKNNPIITDKNKLNYINKNFDQDDDAVNFKKEDNIKIKNDIHNGVFDIMPLDNSLVMETRKREFNNIEIKKVPITNIRPKKVDVIEKTPLDPHHKYTVEELKEKIKKDELKDTLKVKQKYNPGEAKDLEDKIRASGNLDLLKEEEKKEENLKKSQTKSTASKSKIHKDNEEDQETRKKSKEKSATLKNSKKKEKTLKSKSPKKEDEEKVEDEEDESEKEEKVKVKKKANKIKKKVNS